VPVAGVLKFASLSAGRRHTCGVTTAGTAYCWGANEFGQIGARTTQGCGLVERFSCTQSPVAVTGALKFASVNASDVYTCGLTPEGTVYCWGAVEHLGAPATTRCSGRLYYGRQDMCAATPVAVAVGELKFVRLSAAWQHICGVTTTGALYCWGANGEGQLGNGTNEDSEHPTLVRGKVPADAGEPPTLLQGKVSADAGEQPTRMDVGSCNQFGPAYNQNNVCFDTRPAPLSTTSVTVPAGAPIPRAAILLVKVSSTGTTLETRVYVPSNVQTFNAQALGMARALRWLPAQKNGTPVEAWVLWRFEPIR